MTREEAAKIVEQEIAIPELVSSRWVRCWERLGIIKLDEPPNSAVEALAVALGEAAHGPPTAVRVAGFLEKQGYKIFWAPYVARDSREQK